MEIPEKMKAMVLETPGKPLCSQQANSVLDRLRQGKITGAAVLKIYS